MSSGWRRIATGLALTSLAVTVLLFIRETKPFSGTRPAAASAHLTDADVRAFATPIDYAGAIPVLSYHDVSTRPGPRSVTPSMFANQMAALRRAGFHPVSLAQVRDLVRGRKPQLPTRPVLLTFDDGIATVYTRADPILAVNHFQAVSFVVTSRLGDGRKPSYYLSWPQLRALSHSGRWEFGVRGDVEEGDVVASLSTIDPSGSLGRLDRATGSAAYSFSYPVTV